MKRFLALAFSFLLTLLLGLSAVADTSGDGLFTYTVNDDGEGGYYVSITSYDGVFEGDLVLPDELGGYPVTDYRGNVTAAVAEPGSSGLYTTHLTSLTLPKHLDNFRISKGFFSVERYVTPVDADMVYADEVGALYSSDGTEFYAWPAYNRTKEYRIADTVTTIYDAGMYSKYLERLYIPGSVKEIPNTACTFAQSLREVFLGEGVETVSDNATGVCPAMERFVLPSTLTSIGSNGLSGLARVKELVIPASVTSVGGGALSDNAEMERVVFLGFPETFVGGRLHFGSDPALTDIYFAGTEAEFNASALASAIPDGVTAHFEADYVNADNVKTDFDGANLTLDGDIGGGTEDSLYAWDFYRDEAATLTLGDGTGSVGEFAFHDFNQLSELVIAGDDVSVAASAFAGCGSLKTVICAGNVVFGDGALPEDVTVFAPEGAAVSGVDNVVYYSFSGGELTFSGDIDTDAYSFLDTVAWMCARFGGIIKITVSSLCLSGVSFYYYDETGDKRMLEDNRIVDGYVQIEANKDGGDVIISFNELCEGIADESLDSFRFVTGTREHGENVDTPVKISFGENIVIGIRRVLKAIVTLLNRLFGLLKKLGGT